MEDAARFVLNDAPLSDQLKHLRHALRDALDLLGDGVLEANRDTAGDVGTQISTESESSRAGVREAAKAAGKRLSEALRSLEEYGKTIDIEFAAAVEKIRYRGYDIERDLVARFATGRATQWQVCVLLTESLCTRPWLDVLDSVLEAGVDCVQLREKQLDDGKLLGRATAVVRRCHDAGVVAIINDRPDVAMMVGADGVHVGQQDLPVAHIRRIVGHRLLVGVSTFNLVHAEAARRMGADYCGVGPMFETTTKDKPDLAGPQAINAYRNACPLPHLAIGGITPDNIAEVIAMGGEGVAVSSCVCGSDDPGRVVKMLKEAFEGSDKVC